MTIELSLDESSDVPIYQQIVDRIEATILAKNFKPGDFLPSVREFSMKHQVNPNTVSKSYQILQNLGLAESVRGLGLKVAPLDHKFSDKRKREILIDQIDKLISTGIALQLSKEVLLLEVK